MIAVLTSNDLGKDIGSGGFQDLSGNDLVVVLLSDTTRVTGAKSQVLARLSVILASDPSVNVTSYHLVEVKE